MKTIYDLDGRIIVVNDISYIGQLRNKIEYKGEKISFCIIIGGIEVVIYSPNKLGHTEGDYEKIEIHRNNLINLLKNIS